jgi:hypothetical protein
VAEHPAEKNLPWLVLRAANRTQAKGSTVRLIVPRAQEVADELGMELTDSQLLSVEEHLHNHGYIEPANIGLTWGTYTITPAGLRWLEEAAPPSESSDSPTEALSSSPVWPEPAEPAGTTSEPEREQPDRDAPEREEPSRVEPEREEPERVVEPPPGTGGTQEDSEPLRDTTEVPIRGSGARPWWRRVLGG